jgi:hypothetical protein
VRCETKWAATETKTTQSRGELGEALSGLPAGQLAGRTVFELAYVILTLWQACECLWPVRLLRLLHVPAASILDRMIHPMLPREPIARTLLVSTR